MAALVFSFHSECDPVGFCGGMYGGVGWGGAMEVRFEREEEG